MKVLFLLSVCAFLAFGIDLPARAQANDNPFKGAPTRYSVAVVTTQKNRTAATMWMYVDGNKRRTEQETNNGKLVLILRGDLDLMYTIIVSRKAYRVRPFDPSLLKSLDAYELTKDMLHERVATETIKGQVCDKYRFSSSTGKTQSPAEPDSAMAGFIWISKSRHLPVMSKTEGATTEWENLAIGPQESSLFEAPAEFQEVN
jgi:hypothetical protein